MFPDAFRHPLAGDPLYRDGWYVDEVDRGRFERAYRAAGSPRGRHVVDLGAYPGTGLLYFGWDDARGTFSKNRYTGVGHADGAFRGLIESAGHRLREAEFDGDGPLGIADADLVLCMEILEHLRRPYGFLSRLAAELAPGARLYLTTNNAFYSGYILKLLAHRSPLDDLASEGAFYPGHCRYYAASELGRALERLGLVVDSAETFNFHPPIAAYRHRGFGLAKTLVIRALSGAYPSHVEIIARKPETSPRP